MAVEDARVLELLSQVAADVATQTELLRVMMLAVAHTLLSGELAPTHPELKSMLAKSEEMPLELMQEADDDEIAAAKHYAAAGDAMAAALREKAAAYAAAISDAEEAAQRGPDGPTPDTTARNGPIKLASILRPVHVVCTFVFRGKRSA